MRTRRDKMIITPTQLLSPYRTIYSTYRFFLSMCSIQYSSIQSNPIQSNPIQSNPIQSNTLQLCYKYYLNIYIAQPVIEILTDRPFDGSKMLYRGALLSSQQWQSKLTWLNKIRQDKSRQKKTRYDKTV